MDIEYSVGLFRSRAATLPSLRAGKPRQRNDIVWTTGQPWRAWFGNLAAIHRRKKTTLFGPRDSPGVHDLEILRRYIAVKNITLQPTNAAGMSWLRVGSIPGFPGGRLTAAFTR